MTTTTHLVPLTERPLHERVAAVVRAQMAAYGVTQAQLAQRLNITQQSVSPKRSGKTPFTLNELELIAPMFAMEADEILRAARELRPVDPDDPRWAPWGSNPRPADNTSAQVIGDRPAVCEGPEREAAPVIPLRPRAGRRDALGGAA